MRIKEQETRLTLHEHEDDDGDDDDDDDDDDDIVNRPGLLNKNICCSKAQTYYILTCVSDRVGFLGNRSLSK